MAEGDLYHRLREEGEHDENLVRGVRIVRCLPSAAVGDGAYISAQEILDCSCQLSQSAFVAHQGSDP